MLGLVKSKVIAGLEWTGERIPYPEPDIKGDTYPTTWADDDEIYTSAGDPLWGETKNGLDVEKFTGGPTDYKISKLNHMNDYTGWGGNGPKPSGMVCVDGILYLAFQNLLRTRQAPHSLRSQHGSDSHIVYSTDKGGIWTPALPTITAPMFPGHRFGGPSFVQHGRDNADARDDYIYAISSDQWDNGSNLRLGRVPRDAIVRPEGWQWVCAFGPSREPAWSHQKEEAVPVLSIHRWIGLPEMVYLPVIQRYLLLTWRLHADFSGHDGTDLLILEAPDPWGPFSLVHYEEHWEGKVFNPYCPRVPLKWMASDCSSGWIQFSGSWGPEGQKAGFYRSNVRPFQLKMS